MPESEIIFAVEENPEGGYLASALGHSIHTEADSIEDLTEMVRDAVRCHFEETERPRIIRLHLVKDVVVPA
jgi:hypothetical protein